MTTLILANAGFKYGSHTVLQAINLDTIKGEFLGIIGPNGSGKSTLLKGMSGILRPCTGSVSLNGKDIGSNNHGYIARHIALVPQNAFLPELFTVLDIVLMGRTPHLGLLRYESKQDISIAVKAMQATQTQQLASKHINELSGGERQRVLIARTLAQQAGLLLLDEPTASLDINYQAEILGFLRQLCHAQGLSVVAALHDLNLASQYCDRLVMLNDRGIWKQGKPAEIINSAALKEVFGIDVHVYAHPLNGLPTALVTSRDLAGN